MCVCVCVFEQKTNPYIYIILKSILDRVKKYEHQPKKRVPKFKKSSFWFFPTKIITTNHSEESFKNV